MTEHASRPSLPRADGDRSMRGAAVRDGTEGAAVGRLIVALTLVVAANLHPRLTPAAAGEGAPVPRRFLQLPSIWSDRAVVQRDRPLRIWGRGRPSADVTVSFATAADEAAGVTATTRADDRGAWRVELPGREASFDRFVLTVRSGDEVIRLNDILVGDVWLSGGQSNMALQTQFIVGAERLLAEARHPEIRVFHQETADAVMAANASRTPVFDVPGGRWLAADAPEGIRRCSGIAYTFARAVYESLQRTGHQVPVAVINSAVGGSSINQWIGLETTKHIPELGGMLPETWRVGADLTGVRRSCFQPTALYNHKIAPLAPFGLRGVIWLQGESDAGGGEPGAASYRIALRALIEDWRRSFEQPELPFLLLLLHPHAHRVAADQPERLASLAFFREAQLDVAGEVPRVVALPTHDLPLTWRAPGGPFAYQSPIHPLDKRPSGERLARAARGLVYDEPLDYLGPVHVRTTRTGQTLRLTFSHCAGGLAVRDHAAELGGFTLCGSDRVFAPAEARIIGKNEVEVRADSVPAPEAVAYGFTAMNQNANLVNAAGQPAAPFRSDRVPSTHLPVFPPADLRLEPN